MRAAALLLGLAAMANEARAAGGAHVVDDAGVETPGVCHLETWVTGHGAGDGSVTLAPACTRTAWPRVELGASAAVARSGGEDETTFGPALKLNLRPLETGLGLGVIASGSWGADSGRLESAALLAPISVALSERARLNLNAGWHYSRTAERSHQAFYGAQVEVDLSPGWSAMAEAFGHDRGRTGAQFGLRWTPAGGAVDLDLLAGRYLDGATRDAITVGITARR